MSKKQLHRADHEAEAKLDDQPPPIDNDHVAEGAEKFGEDHPAGSMVDAASDDRTLNNVVRHEYRVLTDDEKLKVQRIKDGAVELLKAIQAMPRSLERVNAEMKVEEAVMWAVKGLTK